MIKFLESNAVIGQLSVTGSRRNLRETNAQ